MGKDRPISVVRRLNQENPPNTNFSKLGKGRNSSVFRHFPSRLSLPDLPTTLILRCSVVGSRQSLTFFRRRIFSRLCARSGRSVKGTRQPAVRGQRLNSSLHDSQTRQPARPCNTQTGDRRRREGLASPSFCPYLPHLHDEESYP